MSPQSHNTKIVNLFGGPNSGKSTTAAGLFYAMRLDHMHCELVTEYAKELVYQKDFDTLNNQELVTGEQKRRQDVFLGHTDYVITDSPTLLGAYYMRSGGPELKYKIIRQFNQQDNVNFFLRHIGEVPYSSRGRREDKESALEAHDSVRKMLDEQHISYHLIDMVPGKSSIMGNHIADIIAILESLNLAGKSE